MLGVWMGAWCGVSAAYTLDDSYWPCSMMAMVAIVASIIKPCLYAMLAAKNEMTYSRKRPCWHGEFPKGKGGP